MQIRRHPVARLTIVLLTVALLTGCAKGATPPDSRPPNTQPLDSQSQDTRPPAAADPASSDKTGGSEIIAFPVKPTTNFLQRITYDSTMEIPGPGLYLVDLPTGKVETWQKPDHSTDQGRVYLSDDRRWAVYETDEQISWTNRDSGKAYAWSRLDLELLEVGPSHFLFVAVQEGAGPHTFYVADVNFQMQHTFTLDLGQQKVTQAQFAPDAKTVALNTGRWMQPGEVADAWIYVVDLTTGTSREVNGLPSSPDGQVVGIELLGPATGELAVSYVVQVIEPTGITREQSIVRRYSWQGQRSGEFTLSGRAERLSPDGRLIAWFQNLDYLTSTAVVSDVATGQSRFRVVGAHAMHWSADGSSLVLLSRSGGEYIVSAAGDLISFPPVPRGENWVFMARLMASPDDPHRFVSGLAVVDERGQVLQTIHLPKRDDLIIMRPGWGATGNEFLVTISLPVGKGDLGFDFPLAPQVQMAPFPDPYLLKVQDPQGECLNLRESFTRSSRVIRCLPTGTRLAVADLGQAPVKLNGAYYGNDQQIWLWTRTDQGEIGWVSLSTGSVIWAK